MLDGHAFPATHATIVRRGDDVISTFVFDDGTTQARGVAVVMTPAVVRSTLGMLVELKKQAQALGSNGATEWNRPGEYLLERDPVSVHSVSAVFAEDSEVAVLGFRSIDFAETFAILEAHRGPIVTKLALVVALSASSILGWLAALDAAIRAGGAEP